MHGLRQLNSPCFPGPRRSECGVRPLLDRAAVLRERRERGDSNVEMLNVGTRTGVYLITQAKWRLGHFKI
jgi:hypothetical protein